MGSEPLNNLGPLRDPRGNLDRYRTQLTSEVPSRQKLEQELPALDLATQADRLAFQMTHDQTGLRYQYAMGVPLPAIRDQAAALCRTMSADAQFVRENGNADYKEARPVKGKRRVSIAFAAMALLLVEEKQSVEFFHELVSRSKEHESQLFDLLVKAFDPALTVNKKYKADKYLASWCDPILRALALPPAQRAAALAICMKNWPRTMRPFGWKADLDTNPGKDRLFCDFAFEIALAVCGWDIDDSSFADHPYYPRDLAAWYREHVRHNRDGWRAEGSGAGVAFTPPPLPVRADLAKSKSKGIARWVELVSDGDRDATEAVLEGIGKPRKIKDLDVLLNVLVDANLVIHADIKDDATLAAQADALSNARGLGDFDGPPAPPAGPARCQALLLAWQSWLAERDYRLVAIDTGDDAWVAVVVRGAFHAELLTLGSELAIALGEPRALFSN